LLIAPHTAAELVARMVEAGLLTKARGTTDRRRV
jgi:DNA-binding MarR family transcriptional regulator